MGCLQALRKAKNPNHGNDKRVNHEANRKEMTDNVWGATKATERGRKEHLLGGHSVGGGGRLVMMPCRLHSSQDDTVKKRCAERETDCPPCTAAHRWASVQEPWSTRSNHLRRLQTRWAQNEPPLSRHRRFSVKERFLVVLKRHVWWK